MDNRQLLRLAHKKNILLEVELKTDTGTKYYKLVRGTVYEKKPVVKWYSRYRGRTEVITTIVKCRYFMMWGNEDNMETMGISPLTEVGSKKSQSTVTKIFMKAIEDTKNMTFKRK